MASAVMLVIAGTALDYSSSGSPPGTSKSVIPKLCHPWVLSLNKNLQTPILNYSFI
jgi:hypothetical protein